MREIVSAAACTLPLFIFQFPQWRDPPLAAPRARAALHSSSQHGDHKLTDLFLRIGSPPDWPMRKFPPLSSKCNHVVLIGAQGNQIGAAFWFVYTPRNTSSLTTMR